VAMRLNIKAMTLALGILWGAVMFVTGLANLVWPKYGLSFLQMMASVYPGYKASGSILDFISGVLYALVDGGLFGLVMAWLYNQFIGKQGRASGKVKREDIVHHSPIEPHS